MSASSLGSRIDEVWRKMPIPHQVIWSRSKEAIEYDSALSGRRFDEVNLDDAPFAISSVYIELTEYASLYFLGSYLKQALRYVEDCEKEAFKALRDFSLIQLYSMLSGFKLGAEGKRGVRELVDAYDSNELKEVVREAVDKICENAEKLEFSQEQVREIREYWGKDIQPPGA